MSWICCVKIAQISKYFTISLDGSMLLKLHSKGNSNNPNHLIIHSYSLSITRVNKDMVKPNTYPEFLTLVQNQAQFYIRAQLKVAGVQITDMMILPPAEFIAISAELAKVASYWPLK